MDHNCNGSCQFRRGFVGATAVWLVLTILSPSFAIASELPAEAAGILRRVCLDCHGNDQAEARINLEQMTAEPDFGTAFKDWAKVAKMLRESKMPPVDAVQPTSDERQATIDSIESGLKSYIALHAGDPGAIVLRRLTSAELDYSIEDLTGLKLDLARRFVNDGVGGEGFTNVGAAQFIEDSTLEQYLAAARTVADHAVVGTAKLRFFEHPGRSGRELAAITRIQQIYRLNGFRTAAGEGAKPFGLDLYPRAFLTAWRFRHRAELGLQNRSLHELAEAEGLSVRFCDHVWSVVRNPAESFPLSVIVAKWDALPAPTRDRQNENAVAAACDEIASELRQWQSVLAAAAGDEEEAAVLTEGEVGVRPSHSLTADIDWNDGATSADIEFSVTTASSHAAGGASVIWRNPQIRFTRSDNSRTANMPIASVLSADSRERLKMGHPSAAPIEGGDFVIPGESKVPVRILLPEGMIAARLYVDLELDLKHGADSIVRCRISDGAVEGETAAEVGDTSTLLGDPASPQVERWKFGVAEFARLLPEVSHREPAPSDRDPIPPLFDNTYNMPERNYFHTAIKYYRDDRFLVEHILDDATRRELDLAWADLLTSFDYHDVNMRFAAKKYGVDLEEKSVKDLGDEDIARFPEQIRQEIRHLRSDHQQMQAMLNAAESAHLADVIGLAERAWRRPLSAEEEDRLRGFYSDARRDSQLDHGQAIRALLARVFVAPAFLYRAESSSGGTGTPGDIVLLNDWELASRLSYFLWGSIPDEELWRSAAAGKLCDSDELSRQAKRMLGDPKVRRLATEFFGQWLGFYRFDEYRGIDGTRFPEFNDALKHAMYDEAVGFFTYIAQENRPVGEILFADYSFLNALLARHYGLGDSELADKEHVRVAGLREKNRGGLLGMAAVLTTTSAPLRTSAVKRGDWVLRRILGTPVPPPPADAGSISAEEAGSDGLTVRRRLEAHRANSACVNCHARIDPLGFALEHYDPLGRWRDQYRDGQTIDASGVLTDGTVVEGPSGLRKYLEDQQPQFERHLAGKLIGYALGRSELASDQPLIDEMLGRLEQGGGFADMVVRIVTSKQFRNRRS